MGELKSCCVGPHQHHVKPLCKDVYHSLLLGGFFLGVAVHIYRHLMQVGFEQFLFSNFKFLFFIEVMEHN